MRELVARNHDVELYARADSCPTLPVVQMLSKVAMLTNLDEGEIN
ncbi:hypothetical protein [Lewinella sp. IMCC34183]|nr:hypothetical protein [Lewinella sp. IMCC34183]